MPRGKLVSKTELQRAAAKPVAKRGRPPKTKAEARAVRKQSIAKISRTAKPARAAKQAPAPHRPGISITFQVPSLRRRDEKTPGTGRDANKATAPHVRRQKLQPRLWIPVGVVSVLAVTGGIILALPTKHAQPTTQAAAASRTTPDYQPLMLADQKPTTETYDGRRDMVSYTTTFSGIRVTVSEQPLPANFPHDPAALLRTADSIDAKQRIDTSRGTVFVATNDVAGDQMGVFADAQVLGFIHTDHKMDDGTWKSFVEQLKPIDWQNTKQD